MKKHTYYTHIHSNGQAFLINREQYKYLTSPFKCLKAKAEPPRLKTLKEELKDCWLQSDVWYVKFRSRKSEDKLTMKDVLVAFKKYKQTLDK